MGRILKKLLAILDGTPAVTRSQGAPERGQSLVEMIFIIPILVIMIAGIAEIGWYANNYINLLEAAKVGARRGPFLNEENAPQAMDPRASISPFIASSGSLQLMDFGDPYPNPAPSAADLPRFQSRGITTTTEFPDCESIAVEDFNFYNLVACTTINSMEPLELRLNGKDDIVVSVFSVQRINSGTPGQINPGSDEPYDFDLGTEYPAGHQVVVVGRWPHNANECFAAGSEAEARDPFDYIENGTLDIITVVDPITSDNVLLPIELAEPVYDETTGDIISYTGYLDNIAEYQRGWSWTGQQVADAPGFTGTCYGSEFTSLQVQALMNLPQFIRSGDPGVGGEPGTGEEIRQRRLRHLTSQGVVLVEVFWEHDLILGQQIPIFSAVYDLWNGADDPSNDNDVIAVWAAFPAPAAEPAIIYQLAN
ncbi:MAG: pilus assembly protein [Anaerolineae bacterium]|jgi:hypothetical protein|nr:pilus assembly protein [Anaerolineae bacterium]